MFNRLISNDQPRSRLLAALLIVVLLGLAFAPFLFPGVKALSVAAKVLIFVVLVAGFDLLLGYTGIVSFAHTMFFGIGAYGIAISSNTWGPTWGAIGLGFALSLALTLVLSLAIGLFSLRVRAIFFAMITLAVAAAFQTLASQLSDFTGGEDGLSLAKRIRHAHPLVGIIMLSARSALDDKLSGYDCGADIYLTKPVSLPELSAALRSFARRRLATFRHIAPDGLTLNKLELQGQHTSVKLTAQEAIVLTALARAPAGRLETWQIAELLDAEVDESFKASLAVRMVRLRKKLIDAGAEGVVIDSLRNIGYQLTTYIEII